MIYGQELTGHWEGELTQTGKPANFRYQLDLRQEGSSVSGSSRSVNADGKSYSFILTGVLDGNRLVLQELRQTEPVAPQMCLKYATLTLQRMAGALRLEGDWRAEGCKPGKMILNKTDSGSAAKVDTMLEEMPFSMTGLWTGHLSQSDREYGFYFELKLDDPPGHGSSYIVSEDNGGGARHAMEWSFEERNKLLNFKELRVTEKSDARWPWCIKRGKMTLRREGGRYIMEGDWSGYIEGHDPASRQARCAPGRIYLEKPVLTRQILKRTEQQSQVYAASTDRRIKIERVVEVRRRDIRLRVWDNGTVDGDVCTLFLNGERILRDYRVTKSKWSLPVTLKEDTNFLILHAEDLGDIPPNTVAVSIDDGEREQIIVLSSNLEESGAVLIREFKIGQ